jgi:uncharacterized SAM-binding protein YcdF (DUF218 family)
MERPLTVRDPLERAEVIVVPGARVRPDGSLSRSAVERVRVAARLHAEGWAPLVLLTGGAPDGPFVEARQMALEAERAGIPAGALLLETASRNSWENADFSATLLRRRRLTRAIVVTQAFHTRRIKRAFLRRGILAAAFPVPVSWIHLGELDAFELLVREYVALAIDLAGGRR